MYIEIYVEATPRRTPSRPSRSRMPPEGPRRVRGGPARRPQCCRRHQHKIRCKDVNHTANKISKLHKIDKNTK